MTKHTDTPLKQKRGACDNQMISDCCDYHYRLQLAAPGMLEELKTILEDIESGAMEDSADTRGLYVQSITNLIAKATAQ
jgi:hypothetical protein